MEPVWVSSLEAFLGRGGMLHVTRKPVFDDVVVELLRPQQAGVRLPCYLLLVRARIFYYLQKNSKCDRWIIVYSGLSWNWNWLSGCESKQLDQRWRSIESKERKCLAYLCIEIIGFLNSLRKHITEWFAEGFRGSFVEWVEPGSDLGLTPRWYRQFVYSGHFRAFQIFCIYSLAIS